MHFTTVSALSATVAAVYAQSLTIPVTGLLGNATVVSDNPVGPTYVASLPVVEYFDPTNPLGNLKGSVVATAAANGTGVHFQVNFSNLPKSGGPFLYHIHAYPVNSSGNCLSTFAHLDPFIRGEDPPCDPTLPQTCQVGDLSGKYGKITSDPFTASYIDPYASVVEGIGSFFGNRSINIHYANTTRITCASFALAGNSSLSPGNSTGNGTTSSNTTVTTSIPKSVFTGSASGITASLVLLVAAAFTAMIL